MGDPLLAILLGLKAGLYDVQGFFALTSLFPHVLAIHALLPHLKLDQLPQLVVGVQSLDPSTQLETTTSFRKILSIGELGACGPR